MTNLKHVASKRFTVPELRAVLGVPEGKLNTFSNFKKWAIIPAIAEINSDLTRLTLTATYHKIGRTVAEVEIAWEVKEDLTKVKAELARPKVGRKARQEGSQVEPVLAFPASGSIRYVEPWCTIAKSYGNGKDVARIGEEFRRWWAPKPLDARGIEKSFKTFCKGSKP